jgi:hypothetical protein
MYHGGDGLSNIFFTFAVKKCPSRLLGFSALPILGAESMI